MNIPKITHQTLKAYSCIGPYESYRQRLLELHPGWEHCFYEDADCRQLIEREFPHLLGVYDNYPANIQRVDLFRIAAVYLKGGFYLDLDMQCQTPLDELCRHRCVVAEENTLTAEQARSLGHRDVLRVGNYMFGSQPKHPFWLDVLEEMVKRSSRLIHNEQDILESTGPGLLTHIYHDLKERYPDIFLLRNPGIMCPMPHCRGESCQFGPYASHHHIGSWRWQNAWDSAPKPTVKQPVKPADTKPADTSHKTAEILVLKTYTGDVYDGLTTVFQKVKTVGRVVEDSKHLQRKKVLVPGIPFLYTDKLSTNNINIVYTTFESTSLPHHWVDAINRHYHHCIVPSDYMRGIFISSGVTIPIHTIHLGFTRYPGSNDIATGAEAFRVGFMGIPVKRKNLHKLFQACLQLLDKIPTLKLAVHVSQYYEWFDQRLFDGLKSCSFLEWSEGILSEGEIASWYRRLSCYVFPSSAEGWSFTPRESLFLEVPTIITDIPSHRKLADSGYCTVIPVHGMESARTEWGTFGQWGRVETEDIEKTILEVFNNQPDAKKRATEGGAWITHKWQNSDMESQIVDFLESI